MDSDGDAVVLVDSDLWLLNPAALEDMWEGSEATSRRGSVCINATSVLTANVPCLVLSVSLRNRSITFHFM